MTNILGSPSPQLGLRAFPGGASYSAKIRAMGPIAYLRLADAASQTNAADYSGNNNPWTYSSSAIPGAAGVGDGLTAGAFVAANSNLITPPAGTLTALNVGGVWNPLELTVMAWANFGGTWGDSNQYVIASVGADFNNNVHIWKPGSANTLQGIFAAGGTFTFMTFTASPAGWFHVACTVSQSLNKQRIYLNGVQQGADQAYAGTWAGALTSSYSQIGSYAGGFAFWQGSLAHVPIFNRALTAAEVAKAASIH